MPNYTVFNRKQYALDLFGTQAIPVILENLYRDKAEKDGYTKYEVKQIGRFLEGEAYYHEVDQYYRCIGFEVEVEYQFNFQAEPKTEVGFYSIWVGKSHSCAPITFEESYQNLGMAHKFYNGCGDHIEVVKILKTSEAVEEVIKNLNISLAPPNKGKAPRSRIKLKDEPLDKPAADKECDGTEG